MLKFIHAADFHLDSAFSSLPHRQATARRREMREMPFRLANYVNQHQIDLVLLSGDLFDSGSVFRETGQQLAQALGQMQAQVVIAPGNHDWYGPYSPYAAVTWPENVHIFREPRLTTLDFPQWNLTIHGAAFTGAQQPAGLLSGFAAPQDGRIHFGLLHGEVDAPEARYNPITREEIAASGLAYLALGHIHKRTEPLHLGATLCAWPGCMEGRGFDELGEKGFYSGILSPEGAVSLSFVPFALRRYEILTVDVTGRSPREAVETALPADTASHLYRIILTGETDAGGISLPALQEALASRFYSLELRDNTRIARDIWASRGGESLRGQFLQQLYAQLEAADTDEQRRRITQAARFGLAALEHRDME